MDETSKTDIVLVQYDNRNDRGLRLLMHYAEQYCLKHGYTYICPDEVYELPTYWIKVALVKRILETYKREVRELLVCWMDSDAVFVQDVEIFTLFAMGQNKDFITCLDPGSRTNMNAGVFFVRHSPTMLRLMSDWMGCYNPARWTKAAGKWKTDGKWAGPDYEQGSFNEQILPAYRDSVYMFPEKVMACYDVLYGPETIICHFMFTTKKKIWLYNVRRNSLELSVLVGMVAALFFFAKKRIQ